MFLTPIPRFLPVEPEFLDFRPSLPWSCFKGDVDRRKKASRQTPKGGAAVNTTGAKSDIESIPKGATEGSGRVLSASSSSPMSALIGTRE